MTIYDQMVANYAQKRGTATPNVEQEVMQYSMLAKCMHWSIAPGSEG